MVKPKFMADLPEAVVREGADEPGSASRPTKMLRTFIDTTDAGDSSLPGHFQGGRGIRMGEMKEILRQQEGQGTMDFKRSKRQRRNFLRSGQRTTDPKVGSEGSPLEEPDRSSGRCTETYRAKVCASLCQQSNLVSFCFGDNSHQRDAHHSRHREDWWDAETAY